MFAGALTFTYSALVSPSLLKRDIACYMLQSANLLLQSNLLQSYQPFHLSCEETTLIDPQSPSSLPTCWN